jgi:hypothetical protein
MGGPNYNPGTNKILDTVFDQEGAKQAVAFLYLVEKVAYSQLSRDIDYKFFWNLFKASREDFSEFKKHLESYCSNEEILHKFIPDSIKNKFDLQNEHH